MDPRFIRKPAFLVGIGMVLFTILFLFFFPPMFTSIDEHQYLKNAILSKQGHLKDADPLQYCGGIFRGETYSSTYHIGKSVMLIPFTTTPIPFALFSGLLIHMLNTLLFFFILRRLKVDERWSILFLFFPVLAWEARTLFSEAWALTFLLGGFYAYLRPTVRSLILSGLLFGLAAFTRYETVLISFSFAAVLFWKNKNKIFSTSNPFWSFALGGLVAAAFLLSWNTWLNGNPFFTQFGNPTGLVKHFPQPLFFNNLVLFIGILLIAYPLMLLSPLASKKSPKWELILSSVLTLLLFAHTTNISVYNFFSPLTITARMRYFIPLAGLLLIPYVEVLHDKMTHFRFPRFISYSRILAAIFILLFASTLILSHAHQSLLEGRASVKDTLQEIIPPDSLTIGSSDDCIYFLPGLLHDGKYVRVDFPWVNIEELFYTTPNVYVTQIIYSNFSDSSIRQGVINAERAAIQDFITKHVSELELVYESDSPHVVRIYSKKK